jgi:hypothetical protein
MNNQVCLFQGLDLDLFRGFLMKAFERDFNYRSILVNIRYGVHNDKSVIIGSLKYENHYIKFIYGLNNSGDFKSEVFWHFADDISGAKRASLTFNASNFFAEQNDKICQLLCDGYGISELAMLARMPGYHNAEHYDDIARILCFSKDFDARFIKASTKKRLISLVAHIFPLGLPQLYVDAFPENSEDRLALALRFRIPDLYALDSKSTATS